MNTDEIAPLTGIRVVEVANFLAAPSGAALMADLGANVVKVEPPDGDTFRGNQAHLHGGRQINYNFEVDNRGKRSITVDLRQPRAREAVLRLASQADVFVINLTGPRLRAFGLGFDDVREVNPQIVFAHLTGYGSAGPDADRPGFDSTAFWARSGLMSIMGDEDTPAVVSRGGQGDHPTGLSLLAATLAALRRRDLTNEAQYVEVSLQRVGLWTVATDMQQVLNIPGHEATRYDKRKPNVVTRNAYETSDGRWMMLTMHNMAIYWPRFCRVIGREDWASDERFTTTPAMLQHGPEIIEELEAILKQHPLSYWAERLNNEGCIWAPAATLDEVAQDPQLRESGAFNELEDIDGNRYEVVAAPFTIHGGNVYARSRSPLIGEHTHEVLREFGFSEDEIADYAADRTFG